MNKNKDISSSYLYLILSCMDVLFLAKEVKRGEKRLKLFPNFNPFVLITIITYNGKFKTCYPIL